MTSKKVTLPYNATASFGKILVDYIAQHEQLQTFYNNAATIEGIKKQITEKKQQTLPRAVLYEVLTAQYASVANHKAVNANLDKLLHSNTFTITTAHQPNLLSGPLYFFYKIIHAIQLATTLQTTLPEYKFVPIYYMGSEDADAEELGHLYLNAEKLQWHTTQQGAFGRYEIDGKLLQIIQRINGELAVLPFGTEIVQILESCFTLGKTIQQATFELVHQLLGQYGIVVLIADNAKLKACMAPIFEDELLHQKSSKIVAGTNKKLATHYKVQAQGRDINLFYLHNNIRERIEKNGNNYIVHNTELNFTQPEILELVQQQPEKLSPNVILRGLYQEMILPNVAFIGGGGELAYWLQLKDLFQHYKVCFPVLVVRNSFLLADAKQINRWQQVGFTIPQLFQPLLSLENEHVTANTTHQLQLDNELAELHAYYKKLAAKASIVDNTLATHVAALHAKHTKRITQLEKKLLRAEKRNMDGAISSIRKIKKALFPLNGLQERSESFLLFYARYGAALFSTILQHSPSLEQEFTILLLGENNIATQNKI
jgi:bacillithiol biosynthesis cysteine-adding enzyme BshC